ncbi:MAG: SCO family protein [Alphaproteobacteria bacterium]|nr:SCO family protein [Alphaproteobacteria bacterium]MDE2014649.1 SCO family protein [Alphaproteobacteria bacterium]MDE2075401.1 SCO family protein [Alphaproteobacteria bacterium]
MLPGSMTESALLRRIWTSAALALCLALAACGNRDSGWHGHDITGHMPDLAFTMQRANDGKTVTAADYRGRITLLYFGYTNCPDICPTTLANLSEALRRLGPKANAVRVLFVTVDPDRDALPVLKAYVKAFAPQMDGLRGTKDAIAALARRYRVAFSVKKPTADHPYEVMHSAAVFFFDAQGHARLVTLSTDNTAAIAADIARLEG